MTDSTSPAEPRDLPEQIADSSELSTLGRTLLRRYDHAGVIRTAGIMARSRRHQAIGAHVTSLSRTLQRRWLPGAVGSDLTRPVLVFRQSEPAEAARQPSAVCRIRNLYRIHHARLVFRGARVNHCTGCREMRTSRMPL